MHKSVYKTISQLLEQVKAKKPLVHHITNYVTANDCANVVLAIGASPIMADDAGEVEDIVSLSSALVLNMGTLNQRTIESMMIAGKKANELGIPVIFDPVGAGATQLRNRTAERITSDIKLSVIRGNISEIKAISGLGSMTKGVDASEQDMVAQGNISAARTIAEKLSSKLGCTVAITGAIDVISDKGKTYFLNTGHKMLSMVTGTGCMCTSLIASYCAVTDDRLMATVAGVLTMGIAGEMAYERLLPGNEGSGSFRVRLIDAISRITGRDLEERGKMSEA